MSLRRSLLGTWSLERYFEQPEGQGSPNYPLGSDANGMLIYSADGFMSAFLMRADRPRFESGDWFLPSQDEINAASAFIAYSGRFLVDEAARTVAHDIEVSFFPNWIGQRQVRLAEIREEGLALTPTAPIMSGGRMVVPQLLWRRAGAATFPSTPPLSLGRIDIQRSHIMAAARCTKPAKWMVRRS